MKIVAVNWRDLAHPQAGGSELLVDRLMSGLGSLGHQVTLICGGPVAPRPYEVIRAGGTYSQYLRAPIVCTRHHFDADIVIDVENGLPFFSPIWRRGPSVCLVHHIHTDQWATRFSRPFATLASAAETHLMPAVYRHRLFVAISQSTARSLEGIGVDPARIRVVENGVDLPTGDLGDKTSEPLFLSLSRCVPHKRLDLLLSVWERIQPHVGGRFIMAGDGPELSMLRTRAEGIPGVEVVGRVEEGEKLRLLARSWFLVHAAHHEGWGIAIMEAAAAGTPALAANVPGVRDAIVPNETGVLVDALGPDLEAGLARAWVALAGDRERRDALGRKARERAAQYSWGRSIDRWIDILDEAVMTPRFPRPPGRHPIGPVKRGAGPARRPPASQADQIDAAGAMVSTLPPGRGVRRSMALWQGFRRQFADPDHFYTMLGNDTAAIIDGYHSLAGRYVLDVGGGPGYFAEAFRRYQAASVFVEPFWEEMTPPGRSLGIGVMGDGLALPFGDGIFDVVHSSNVIEHVESPEQLFDELVRVASPGGTVFIAFTNWLSPFGGHETSPWHYLGGERAALRYERRRGYPPKNRFGKSLFPLSIRRVLDLARDHPEVELIDVFPRYYPMWTRPVVAVPGVREVVTWNLALVLQRRGSVKT